ncbi:MAG: ribosome biogenesis GTPase Der [Actinomycetes bacterium]|jgi:GTP-binding protein|nr:ribosome biogenesis GTPase Der [Actinomycetes bacterium]
MNQSYLPVVAVIGRPNVGKSSFVNRMSGRADAIVDPSSGVTRDRSYHEAEWNGRHFMLIDTGGVELSRDDTFQASIRAQAEVATRQADLIVLLVDGKAGLVQDDEELARLVKRADHSVPVFLVVNKVDTPNSESEIWPFFALGLGEPWALSATHGTGTGDLLDALVDALPQMHNESPPDEVREAIKVAIIGRPNAGKSSLVNRLSRADRAIVSDLAGTTRDAIDTHVSFDERDYVLIDTAGLRRKSLIDSDVEYYGFVRAMRAIDRCDVALLVVDAPVGLTDQDQRIASYATQRGCALVVLLNKWDLMKAEPGAEADTLDDRAESRETLLQRTTDRLGHVSWAEILRISALNGHNTHKVMEAVTLAYEHYIAQIPTSALNRLLTQLREFGHAPAQGTHRLRLNYVTQTHTAPPGFTFFCNMPQLVDDNFRRYLENRLREAFDLRGTPLTLKFKKKGS